MEKHQAISAVKNLVQDQLNRTAARRCKIQINSEALETDPVTGNLCPSRIERVQNLVDQLYQREATCYGMLADLRAA